MSLISHLSRELFIAKEILITHVCYFLISFWFMARVSLIYIVHLVERRTPTAANGDCWINVFLASNWFLIQVENLWATKGFRPSFRLRLHIPWLFIFTAAFIYSSLTCLLRIDSVFITRITNYNDSQKGLFIQMEKNFGYVFVCKRDCLYFPNSIIAYFSLSLKDKTNDIVICYFEIVKYKNYFL